MRRPETPRVELAPEADEDLKDIVRYTRRTWGDEQARDYLDELTEATEEIARDPSRGRPVDGFPSLRGVTFTWKKAKHGHRIIYQPFEGGIYVLGFVHTARDLPRVLRDR